MIPSVRNGARRVWNWYRERREKLRYVDCNPNTVTANGMRNSFTLHRLTLKTSTPVMKRTAADVHEIRKSLQGSRQSCWHSNMKQSDNRGTRPHVGGRHYHRRRGTVEHLWRQLERMHAGWHVRIGNAPREIHSCHCHGWHQDRFEKLHGSELPMHGTYTLKRWSK